MNRVHKILQDIHFSVYAPEYDDLLEQLEFVESESILEHCIRQWNDPQAQLVFPSKSINVAVIYARLLEHHFKQPALEYLSDPHLLYDLDKYFQPYPAYQTEYDTMLEIITVPTIQSSTNPSVKKTVGYFTAEFMIGSPEYRMLTKVATPKRK